LRLDRRLAERSESDRARRPRLGVDGVRLGRGPPVQLHRRRSEHLPDLERDPARRARRVRARLLPRLPDRPRGLHRGVLQQPRLDRRQRLGREVRHPPALTDALLIAAGYLAGSIPTGYWVVRAVKGVDLRTVGSGTIGASNTARAFTGRSRLAAWLFVLVVDLAKGFAPTFVAITVLAPNVAVATGAAARLANCRPAFM